jgi:hypothetical protein
MFNLSDIISKITDLVGGGAADSIAQITENLPALDQITEPLTQITENLPEIPGLDILKPGK